MNKIKIFAICGKAGSGKDTILKTLFESYSNSSLHKIIPSSTRPMREGESQGNPYNFTTKEEYMKFLLNGDFIEATSFRDWFYGTHINALNSEKINVGIFNLNAIEVLNSSIGLDNSLEKILSVILVVLLALVFVNIILPLVRPLFKTVIKGVSAFLNLLTLPLQFIFKRK